SRTKQEPIKHIDALFINYEFVETLEHKKKLVRGEKTDSNVAFQLAESYYHLFNTVANTNGNTMTVELILNYDVEDFNKYVHMLKARGRYDSSNKIMKKYADLKPEDSRAIDVMQDPDYIPALRSQEALFTFEDSRMNNSQFSDFGGVLTTDNILYFASARDESKKKYGWNDQPFLNVYAATYVADEEKFKDIKPVDDLNTKHHDGPTTITADGQTMFFATESFRGGKYEKNKKNRLKKGKVSVYRAKYNGKK